jgi:prohibitin 1
MSIRAEPKEIKSRTGTQDLQTVSISLRVLARPVEERLPDIFDKLGVNFIDRILPSIANEVLKAAVAKYKAEDLLSKRAAISTEIKYELERRANTFGLDVVDVAITHLTFGKEFSNAIEAKQVAQQEAERQQWVVEKADKEREAAVIRAEGEAEAAQIVNAALAESGPGLIEVRRIDTAKEIASALAQSRNVTYLPGSSSGSNILLGLNPGAQ